MPEQCGKDFLLQRDKDGGPTFVTIGGLRTKSFSMGNEAIEKTNHGSNQKREILDGCGIFSMSGSGSGIYDGDADTVQALEAALLSGILQTLRFTDVTGRTYTGLFKITTFERAGEFNAEATYSISFESSGDIVIA